MLPFMGSPRVGQDRATELTQYKHLPWETKVPVTSAIFAILHNCFVAIFASLHGLEVNQQYLRGLPIMLLAFH